MVYIRVSLCSNFDSIAHHILSQNKCYHCGRRAMVDLSWSPSFSKQWGRLRLNFFFSSKVTHHQTIALLRWNVTFLSLVIQSLSYCILTYSTKKNMISNHCAMCMCENEQTVSWVGGWGWDSTWKQYPQSHTLRFLERECLIPQLPLARPCKTVHLLQHLLQPGLGLSWHEHCHCCYPGQVGQASHLEGRKSYYFI